MTSSELKEKFEVPFPPFINPVEWQDGVGFSVMEEYENEFASLYKVGFQVTESESNPIKDIWISVSYGKKVEGGISLGSSKGNLKTPIDLDFHKEFSYNTETDKFYFQNKEINSKDILLKIQKVHKLPTQIIKGSLLRFRLWLWRKIIPKIIRLFDEVLIGILWLISGEKIKNDIMARRLFEKPNERIQTIEFADPKMMSFFGYPAKRWSVVFYCVLHLLGYFLILKFAINHNFFSKILKSNFLSLCYVVVTFSITEYGLPEFLKFIIKSTPKLYSKIVFKRLNIKTS